MRLTKTKPAQLKDYSYPTTSHQIQEISSWTVLVQNHWLTSQLMNPETFSAPMVQLNS